MATALGAAPSSKPATPAPAPASSSAALTFGIWTLKTNPFDFNEQSGDFSAPNKVFVTREGGDISADRANGNFKRQLATLYGNVVMHDQNGGFAGMATGSVPKKPQQPSTLTTDQLQIDDRAKVYTAIGHVHYVQGSTTVDSDRATLDDASHMLYLSGHARILQGARSLVADHIAYNTVTGQGQATNATMQFPSSVQPRVATPKPINIPGITHAKPTPTP